MKYIYKGWKHIDEFYNFYRYYKIRVCGKDSIPLIEMVTIVWKNYNL